MVCEEEGSSSSALLISPSVAEQTTSENQLGQFIPLHYHYHLLADQSRLDPFRAVIEAVVPKGGKVLELGGGTGVLSAFASRNAAKVWCVERNPTLVAVAERNLARNGISNVELVEADAFTFLPEEPVDVVICEMLHVGMLVERQLEVLDSFKRRYRERFGAEVALPTFIPEAFFSALQPVEQDFSYHGYQAYSPVFQDPLAEQPRTLPLAAPAIYASCAYDHEIPLDFQLNMQVEIQRAGELNAIRLITKNLCSLRDELIAHEWFNHYLLLPLEEALAVDVADTIEVALSYQAAAALDKIDLTVSTGGKSSYYRY